MKKNLPELFHNPIDKKISNNDAFYYSCNDNSDKKEERSTKNVQDTINIRQKINNIFSSPSYISSSNVTLLLKSGERNVKIIGRNKDYLITIDNEKINIEDILDINNTK
jgi:hypothetical protein